MSLYNALTSFAKEEGWDAALAKAENWRDALEEMVEVASPCQKEAIDNLMGSLHLFFQQYQVWLTHRRPKEQLLK